MEFCILGPLEALDEGRKVALGGTKQRAVLALLLVHANETLSTDRLVDELWGDRPPAAPAKTLQMHISRLRRALGGGAAHSSVGVLVTRDRGYELRLDPERIDARRFERLASVARSELAASRPVGAASTLEEALSLWRGPPLADLAYEPFAQREIARLDDLRVDALELLIEAKLELGRHDEVVPQLETLIAQRPYRERLHAQLMLALYRCDRQADALQAYQDARRKLVEELGLEPGERMRQLERAILAQDPALAAPAREAVELPPELDAETPMSGREGELGWLRGRWRQARRGSGSLILVVGESGMGKTRLAAELAAEVQRDHGAVLYTTGAGPPDVWSAVIVRARAAQRPTLVVVDDVDRASNELYAALDELANRVAALPVFVIAAAEDQALAAALGAAETLTLAPLDADSVRAVARLYARADDDVEIPVARLAAASGGVPQRLHQAAGEWARAEAARRLGATAGRAASERADLRAVEDELVDDVVELQVVRERTEQWRVVACPFKGLASFDVDDAEVFFGRERLVAEMVARLAGAPLMGIVGPSGSGKSSALRAGLLASLAAGVLPGSDGWALALLRPGEHPLRALEHATAYAARNADAVAPSSRLVVAVDQFEELFTTCRDNAERAAFVDALLAHVGDAARPALVLVAVRADFYGRCAAYPELSRLLGANHVLVGPMRRGELRRAIELPARRAGLRMEPDLVEDLVADVESEPGALPLLSASLLELWQLRDGRILRHSAYEQAGGVRGAVARLAERAYERLEPEQRAVARRILLRLAGEGEGDTIVRRRVGLSELDAERDQEAAQVLAALSRDRLVTIGEGEVEVAHEALLREWPRLRGWLEEDAHGRRLHEHLRAAASAWDVGARDPDELYRGARLVSALDWAAGHDPELNATERAFLDASRSATERAQLWLRAVLAGVASLLVVAVIAAVVAMNERGNARDEASAAAAQRLGAQALLEDDLDRSLLLARQGVALDDSPQTRSNLLAALLRSPAAIGVVRGDGDRLIGLDLSPDERTLAFVDNDGTLRFVDARTRRTVGPPVPVDAGVTIDSALRLDHLRFSPDGSRVAIGGSEPVLLDVRTGSVIAPLPVGAQWVYSVRFSPDGRTLFGLVALPSEGATSLRRFDARTGLPLGEDRLVSQDTGVTLMVSRDGRRLLTTSSETGTVIRDARTLGKVRRWPLGADAAALSPDDRTMLAGAADGSVSFLDVVTGEVRAASGRHEGAVERAIFSADGRRAITVGKDGRLIAWDVRRAAAGEALEGHAAEITGLAMTRDGSTLYSSGLDSKVLVWDLGGDRRLGRSFNIAPGSFRHALSPDGRTLALGAPDGAVALIDARTLRTVSNFPVVPDGPVAGMGYVPGGRVLVVGGNNGFLALVDPRRGRIVKRLRGHRQTVSALSFSVDGRLMATASVDTVQLYELPSGRPFGDPLRGPPDVGDASLSPDGRTLAVTRPPAGGVEIRDVPTLRRRASLPHAETVWDLARFTPDRRFIVGGSWKGWARLWSTDTWKPASRTFSGHAGRVVWQSTSPDGRTLATGGPDGSVRLWDLDTQEPLGAALPGVPNRYLVPEFTPDGEYLFTISDAGRAYRWNVRPSAWARHACAVAGRSLTRSEWKELLPERDYEPAC